MVDGSETPQRASHTTGNKGRTLAIEQTRNQPNQFDGVIDREPSFDVATYQRGCATARVCPDEWAAP
ncbi:hypothetical protein BJD99_14825 [Rhodococcus sp. 1163]|nr:hypothetical protein BJD99_14825 [Rhodococcus sp. 1163]